MTGTKLSALTAATSAALADLFYLVQGGTSKKITKANLGGSATNPGFLELATPAEAQAGTDTARAVTPAGLAYAMNNVKYYGAIGDGAHDDTAAIQAAINAIPSGSILFFPTGTYNLSAVYSASAAIGFGDSFTTFAGQGESTIIKLQADIAAFQLLGGTSGGWYYPNAQSGVEFHNIKFTSTVAHTGQAIKTTGNTNHLKIYDCFFFGLGNAIEFGANSWNHAANICGNHFGGNINSIYCNTATALMHDFRILNNKESGMEDVGYTATPVSFINLTGNAGQVFEWLIADNSIEHMVNTGVGASCAIQMLQISGVGDAIADVVIVDNMIETCDFGIVLNGNNAGVDTQLLSDFLIANNSLRDLETAVKITGAASTMIVGNMFINAVQDVDHKAIEAYNLGLGKIYTRSNMITGYHHFLQYIETGTTPAGTYDTIGDVVLSIGTNLLGNAGFETAGGGGADVFANWTEYAGSGTVADEGTLVYAGSHACKLTAGADLATQVNQTLTVIPEKVLCLGIALRGNGTTGINIRLWDNTHDAEIPVLKSLVVHNVTVTNYVILVRTYLIPVGCVSVKMIFLCPQTNGHIAYVDETYLTTS